MARDIRGYYFDAERGKYFKVQPNHAVPGAGTTAAAAAAAAAKYSQQAVAAHAATVKRRRLDDKAQTRRLRETVQRPRLLEQQQDPLTRLRMRNAIEGVYAGGRSNRVVADVAACYGAGLVRRTLLVRDHLPLVQKFAVDEVTAAMVTAASSGIPGRNFVSHWPHFRRRGGGGAPYTEISYDIMPTEEPVSALLITPRPRNFVMWATPAGSRHPGSIRIVPFGQGLERGGREGPGRDDEDDDDDGGGGGGGGGASRAAAVSYGDTAIAYAIPDVDIWDMAASPSGLGVVAGCTSGLCVFGDASQQPQQGWGSTMTRRHRDTEFMAVAFKDEHVVLAGTRAGAVHVADLRSGAGTATALTRLRHGSGVTAVRALANDNYVAVRGLATVSIYDLRYTPLSKALSRPYMTFGGACAADRFGLGFDYDPVLGLIATAHSSPSAGLSGQPTHQISLLSTRTGKAVPSPITTHAFSAPVTCIQFTNAIRARSNRPFEGDVVGDDSRPREDNEPKSIVTASGPCIDEWSIQGLRAEEEWLE